MKVIPTYIHGIFDYVGGIVLLFAPNIFGFSEMGGAAVIVPRVIGALVLMQAVLTDYEVGLLKILPMKVHLMNDYVASIFLALSPWIFGFATQAKNVWMPHFVVGLLVFLLSLMTETAPKHLPAEQQHQHPA